MLFNSFEFILFFVVVTTLYFVLPYKYRNLMLLVASCYFYMAFIPVYIVILGATIVIDYFAGILLGQENERGRRRSKLFLVMSLVANIGVLAVFKYFNFLNDNITWIATSLGMQNHIPYLKIALPIGLSFHTFQAMSYTIEVYRGNQKAERNFLTYALYVMFYPQLVAGPIERPQNILHQFYEQHDFNARRMSDGLKLILWGLFKKVVIADRLAMFTDPVFNDPAHHNGIALCIAAFFFSFQIFCDFSGYSDIAIGCAQAMGFRLMKNFDRPYQSTSISEFWKRWHISLSTWFRDYLYISLGGNRVSIPRWYFNLFIVFLISGLWHGASWTFIIWGALHGFYLVFALITEKTRIRFTELSGLSKLPKLNHLLQVSITFLLVTFAWIFFRADSFDLAMIYIQRLPLVFTDLAQLISTHKLSIGVGTLSLAEIGLAFLLIAILASVHRLQNKGSLIAKLNNRPAVQRWAVYYAGILSVIFLGVFENRQFIYFQF